MMIELHPQFTAADLQEAYNLHFQKLYPVRSKLFLFIGIVAFFIGGAYYYVADFGWALFWGVYGCFCLGVQLFRNFRLGKRMLKKQQNLMDVRSIVITETIITTDLPDAHSEIKWAHFKKAIISKTTILLYPNDLAFHLFPRRFFANDEDFASVKSLAEKKIPKIILVK